MNAVQSHRDSSVGAGTRNSVQPAQGSQLAKKQPRLEAQVRAKSNGKSLKNLNMVVGLKSPPDRLKTLQHSTPYINQFESEKGPDGKLSKR